jgi:hypothetical protein
LPADLSCVDWFLVSFDSGVASGRVIVHDSGTCEAQVDPDTDDPEAELVREPRQRAGTLDTKGAIAVLERVVSTLAEIGNARAVLSEEAT